MKRNIAIILSIALSLSLIGCGGETGQPLPEKIETQSEEKVESASDEKVEDTINTSEFTFSNESEERIFVEKDAREAIDFYLVARMYLDKFLQYDIENGNEQEYERLLNDTIVAFRNVEVHSEKLAKDAKALEDLQADESYISTDETGKMGYVYIAPSEEKYYLNPFMVTVNAAEESEAVKWARDITERFDKAPVGKGIKTLAEQMGTDAKHAYAQLSQAQEILAGNAYNDFAQKADAAYKTAKVLKTAGTAAQLTLSIVTADPLTTTEAVMAAGGILVNGVNTILEVGQTGSVLIVGDDNKVSETLENVENAIAPIGSAIGLYSLSTNLAKGAKLLNDTPALADSVMYIGTSLNDYLSDGKIMGGTFVRKEDGTLSYTIVDSPLINSVWDKTEAFLKSLGYTPEEIAEVKESKESVPESFNPEAEIPTEEIDAYLETMSAYLPEADYTAVPDEDISEPDEPKSPDSNSDDTKSSDTNSGATKSDDTNSTTFSDTGAKEPEKKETESDKPDTSDSNIKEEKSPIPDISELEGYYNFYVYMTLEGQSGEGYNPMTIKKSGSDKLSMIDSTGYKIEGTYDSSTGKSVFTDPSDGSKIYVDFTRKDNGTIFAKINCTVENGTMSGSATK